LNYEVELLSKDIISISYKGSEGAAINNDFITDFDELSRLLLEDKFENISIWDSAKETQKIS